MSSIKHALETFIHASFIEKLFLFVVGVLIWGALFVLVTVVKILSSFLPVLVVIAIWYIFFRKTNGK